VTRFQTFAQGLALTTVASLASLALTFWGFKRTYYLAVLIPVFMAFYVLLAWLVYLRKTSFLGFGARTAETGTDISEDKISGAELLGRRDPTGLLPRRPNLPDSRFEGFLKNPIPALLWSAFQLAVLATVLYRFFGVGASYRR
jgi:hypothetical protein